jgi:pimeloyl-ACP methyl ester carboxylesterase
MLDHAARADWTLDPERITCPVRVVWGTADRLLPWPTAAVRFRSEIRPADR